jgi:hypothetical protein
MIVVYVYVEVCWWWTLRANSFKYYSWSGASFISLLVLLLQVALALCRY